MKDSSSVVDERRSCRWLMVCLGVAATVACCTMWTGSASDWPTAFVYGALAGVGFLVLVAAIKGFCAFPQFVRAVWVSVFVVYALGVSSFENAIYLVLVFSLITGIFLYLFSLMRRTLRPDRRETAPQNNPCGEAVLGAPPPLTVGDGGAEQKQCHEVDELDHEAIRLYQWLLFVLVTCIIGWIYKYPQGMGEWPKCLGRAAIPAFGIVFVLPFAIKVLRPFPWVFPLTVAVICARKWFFDAPTWNVAIDAGLFMAFVLLVVLHLMKGSR